jgi:hypothetical protein
MHEGQLRVTADTVGALIADQFPAWSALPIRRVQAEGTVKRDLQDRRRTGRSIAATAQ